MLISSVPGLMIAGTGGDCGKTLISLSLAAYFRSIKFAVAAFKKGPDYIDAAWLSWAAGSTARNLDTYMVDKEIVRQRFFYIIQGADLALIEGNRGLYDGLDKAGTHSSAELAKLLGIPVILVVNAEKVTRTTAAVVLGCMKMDAEVNITGVIFNKVAGGRHEEILRKSLESVCGIPAIGFIPILKEEFLPGRHLGLVTPYEHPDKEKLADALPKIAEKYLDINLLKEISRRSKRGEFFEPYQPITNKPREVRICVFSDSAFSFYYPENLEAMENAGAEIIQVSSLTAEKLPECEGLYIGGGFPETHLQALSRNRSLLISVKEAAEWGMPIYAECGGLMYLCQSMQWGEEEFPLAGVFPVRLQMEKKPQGHGYMEVEADCDTPYFPKGSIIRGHEFHYSRMIEGTDKVDTIFRVKRGSGSFSGRDGLIYKNTVGCYLHIHALGAQMWAENFVAAGKKFKTVNRKRFKLVLSGEGA